MMSLPRFVLALPEFNEIEYTPYNQPRLQLLTYYTP